VPGLLAGGQNADGIAFVDVDDTIREVHGYAKQGAASEYSGVRGLNAQLALVGTPTAAPVTARARLRAGNTSFHRGAGRLLTRVIRTARPGVQGTMLVRRRRARITTHGSSPPRSAPRRGSRSPSRMNAQVTAAIAISSIGANAWTPIRHLRAVWEERPNRKPVTASQMPRSPRSR